MIAKLYVMCGLQCSGKSTKARELAEQFHGVILSSDELRKEFPDANNETIFKVLYNRMNLSLQQGRFVIVDATNTTVKMRKQIFSNLKVECEKTCYIMNTPYEECLSRLEVRNTLPEEHFVPLDVLKKYYYSFEIPFYEEGWDNIILDRHINLYLSERFLLQIRMLSSTFDQQNMHHTQNLGDHMSTVSQLLEDYPTLSFAGQYHDLGKLFTQVFKSGDPNAHYYNHANVGAYIAMCNYTIYVDNTDTPDDKATLDWLFYINYHMHLFNCTTDKSIKKWKGIFGETRYKNLEIFNEADKKRI